MFVLDLKLKADTFFITDLKMSHLLLMNNANYPWLILVPRKPDLVELVDLSFAEQSEVLREINLVSKILQKKFQPKKLNIANLGNIVRQLHIHIIARFEDDAAFPKPVWGEATKPYAEKDAQNLIAELKLHLKNE
ncbi:MAG: HIT domain-containing protein [Proteobacteria bacterium]|nr:HIT domain-containing protein [Pseudomonadota bacterium]